MVDVEKFFREGSIIIEGVISSETIDAVKSDITDKINKAEVTTQAEGFHYSGRKFLVHFGNMCVCHKSNTHSCPIVG